MMSPNWPTGNYPALSVCTWRISMPSNTSIHVGFSHFELQKKNLLGNCVDYVDVINGENMETLGRFLSHPGVSAMLWVYFIVSSSSSSTELNVLFCFYVTGRFCGSAPPANITIPSNTAVIRFLSDTTNQNTGFRGYWTTDLSMIPSLPPSITKL